MSGTSADGIDAALVTIHDTPPRIELVAARGSRIPPGLRQRILAASQPGNDGLDIIGPLDVELGRLFAQAAIALLEGCGFPADQVDAIGSHGQTVRHRVDDGNIPFTVQVGDPSTIAEITGITTVADFRRRDLAAGGQGAPLVPAFHAAIFGSPEHDRVVANIGGMANVTLLPAGGRAPVRGFDTGPGNVLLDAWHERHRGGNFDDNGNWARSGQVDAALLAQLLAEPFLARVPPKSTGRELFNLDWLDAQLATLAAVPSPADVQATLTEFTARSIADAVTRWGFAGGELFICGGGAHNGFLRERMASLLPGLRIDSTAALGVDPDWVEAMAFAWLAYRTLAGLPGNLPAVTGARHPVVLGGIYPGTMTTA